MTRIKKLVLVIGISALANFALPRQSPAISCSRGPCFEHTYQFCCSPPLRCKTFSC